MVVLTGPCMSLEARGTLNDTITYAVLGRTAYVKTYFKPANPKSSAQTGTRSMTKHLTQNWSTIHPFYQTGFEPLAQKWHLSNYHAYLKFNSQRWNGHQMPRVHWGDLNPLIFYRFYVQFSTNGLIHDILIRVEFCQVTPFACQCCFATTSDFTPARSNTKIIMGDPSQEGNFQIFRGTWIAPDPSTYYIKARFSCADGQTTDFYPEGVNPQ